MDENCCTSDRTTEIRRESCVVTRLRSGVISPVTYYPRVSLSCCEKVVKSRKKKKIDVFERLFRRHSCPIRPCTSYALFVMATWGDVKSSSFGETSKKLGQLWCRLPQKDKKVCGALSQLEIVLYNHFFFLFKIYKNLSCGCSYMKKWLSRTMQGTRGNPSCLIAKLPKRHKEDKRIGFPLFFSSLLCVLLFF